MNSRPSTFAKNPCAAGYGKQATRCRMWGSCWWPISFSGTRDGMGTGSYCFCPAFSLLYASKTRIGAILDFSGFYLGSA